MKLKALSDFTKKRICLAVLLLFSILTAFYFIIMPKVNSLILKSKEIELLKEMDQISSLQKSKLSSINWVIDKIPDQNPLYTFTIELEEFAKKNNLIINKISTKDEFYDDVTIVPMKIVVKGTHSSLSTFLQFIDEYPVAIDTVAFQLNYIPTSLLEYDNNTQLWELIIEVNLFYLTT